MSDADVLPTWTKSSFSYGKGECVELTTVDDDILHRDSKDPNGPHLRFTRTEIAAFLLGAMQGEFDHLHR